VSLCGDLTREQANALYLEVLEDNDTEALRELCRNDLFFLLTVACKRKDIDRDWLYERCREVEAKPDGQLDLWARDHYKSTLITFGKTIQDLLVNPELTVGIFSHTRPIAKGFLDQIKRELEANKFLQGLFPDALWEKPTTDAPRWSLDGGIILKRKTNPKEASIEAWGLVDGQPTGKHFTILVYDDMVTRESVTTAEQIKKVTSAWELSQNLGTQGGRKRYIGTRYHANDTYRTMMDRGSVETRLHPATDNGKMDGTSVFLPQETLAEKRRDMGPYTFACFTAGSPVLMSDWSEKPIEQIKVGDEVVGYALEPGKRAKLTRSKVLAVNVRTAPTIEAKFESGRSVRCTPDHKWYTGRRGKDVGGTDSHLAYVPLGFDKNSVKSLISVYDPRLSAGPYDERSAAWLAGFFDGEGSTSGNSIHFHQTFGKNLVVCEMLEACLRNLGFDFGKTKVERENERHEPVRDYFLKGGRAEILRFLRLCRPARSHKIIQSLFDNGTRNFGKKYRDKLVSIDSLGEQEVFNIQTETGNYVCYGYATKNCQMLQDPVADKSMGFREEWLKFYEKLGDVRSWNKYIVVDPASKRKVTSDYTSMWVIGLAPDGNYYVIDMVRDRLNLTQRCKRLFDLHREHMPTAVGYEHYGMQSDIEHIKYVQEQENYRFNIIELGGSLAKEDRIQKLVPVFEQGRMWLPKTHGSVNYEGRRIDLIRSFIDDEYMSFPVATHDDMLDCMARILDPGLDAKFPKVKPKVVDEFAGMGMGGSGWMG
jgi:predicted phage terminase large subunit-like protein